MGSIITKTKNILGYGNQEFSQLPINCHRCGSPMAPTDKRCYVCHSKPGQAKK